jgi:hypothetical protein
MSTYALTPTGRRDRRPRWLRPFWTSHDDGAVAGQPEPGPPVSWPRTVLYGAGVVFLYAVLAAVMTYPQVTGLHNAVAADDFDPLFSVWRLSWVAHQLPRAPAHLFDGNIFYPEPTTLAYSDAMLAPALMAAPLLWLGVHQVLVYNLLLLSAFALSGAAMFLLVRSQTGQTGAAFVAGFVFAFLPYRFLHYLHLELQVTYWMPLCLWALHRTLRTGRYRDGLLTGACFAGQMLSSVYYGIFLATYLIPVAAVLFVGARRAAAFPAIRALAAGGALAAVLIAPLAPPYLEARKSVGERSGEEIYFYSATPTNYLAAPAENAMFGRSTAKWGGPERFLFQGITVPVLAVASLWPPLSATRVAYVVGGALAFNVSLGIKGIGYERMRRLAFPYRGLRAPARMSIFVGFSLAVLCGQALARSGRYWRTRPVHLALLAIVTSLIYVEYRSTPLLRKVSRTPPAVYEALAASPGAVLLDLPVVSPDTLLEPTYMYFSTFHWHPIVNGYSGFIPPSYRPLPHVLASFPDDASVAEIHRRGVGFVAVHGAFYTPDGYATVIDALARRPEFVLERTATWDGRETRLYRVVR